MRMRTWLACASAIILLLAGHLVYCCIDPFEHESEIAPVGKPVLEVEGPAERLAELDLLALSNRGYVLDRPVAEELLHYVTEQQFTNATPRGRRAVWRRTIRKYPLLYSRTIRIDDSPEDDSKQIVAIADQTEWRWW